MFEYWIFIIYSIRGAWFVTVTWQVTRYLWQNSCHAKSCDALSHAHYPHLWVNLRHTHSSATRVLPFLLYRRVPDLLLEIDCLVSRTHWVGSTHLVSSLYNGRHFHLISLSHTCYTAGSLPLPPECYIQRGRRGGYLSYRRCRISVHGLL